MYGFLDWVRTGVRAVMTAVARLLNTISGGKLTPNSITIIGLLAHLPIAWLIAQRHPVKAAVLLIIFGLFDALDGALARLQNSTSSVGIFLDSSTDRIKEVLIYCGIVAFFLYSNASAALVIAAVGALGASLVTSYLNAMGDAIIAKASPSSHQANKTFRSGLLSFDLRIFLIIIGLLFGQLKVVIYIILVLASLTIIQRFINVVRRLKDVQA